MSVLGPFMALLRMQVIHVFRCRMRLDINISQVLKIPGLLCPVAAPRMKCVAYGVEKRESLTTCR